MLSGDLADAYSRLLLRHRWDWFLTLTFRPSHASPSGGIHPEKADKAFRVLVSKLNRQLSGVRWYKNLERQVVWCRGQEFHKSGRIHFHSVMAYPRADLNHVWRRMAIVDWWYKEFGIARVEVPENQDRVREYITKYVVKGGEIDFSPSFGRTTAPAEYDAPCRTVEPHIGLTWQGRAARGLR